jgi:transcriptional regulator with XRE-family HTH domain
MPENEAPLARNLRRLRQARGLTQSQLATLAGMHQVRIAELESGRVADPHVSTLVALAKALRCRLDDLAAEPKENQRKSAKRGSRRP